MTSTAALNRRCGNIILIGMMGSGKTTVGQALAESRGLRFVDTDALITERAGMPITAIFARYGEQYFRALEADTARQLPNHCRDTVIATGGGMVLAAQNMAFLCATGTTVYLRASAETLLARIASDTGRPLLAPPPMASPPVASPLVASPLVASPLVASPLVASLSVEDMSAKIRRLLSARDALYERYSDFAADTDCLSAEELVEEIKERIP